MFLVNLVENLVGVNGILTPLSRKKSTCVTGREICLYIKFIMEER